jgi:asparagine synthase (glutamine-hydrolysing)
MCGFAGFVDFDGRYSLGERKPILMQMGAAIAHRGPDALSYYSDGALSLVFARLAIVDPQHGHQPLKNVRGNLTLVANGEIYNHHQLRQQLTPEHTFLTASDSEVLLHGFAASGPAFLRQCHGMFALALWESNSQTLYLARDRLGIKPLYVCRVGNNILFASELKALLAHPACPRQVQYPPNNQNPDWLDPTPSYIAGIEFVPGASWCRYTAAAYSHEKYWQLESAFVHTGDGNAPEYYQDAFDELLEQVVAEHIPDNQPLAIHLSGGLDSSLLTKLAAQHSDQLSCFTVVERATYLAGDVEAARKLCRTNGITLYPVLYDYETFIEDSHFDLAQFEQAVWMIDSPRFDIEWLFKELLNRTIRDTRPDIKVLLLGQGVDEFCGGYSHRHDAPYPDWTTYLSREIQPMLLAGGLSSPLVQDPYQQAMLIMLRQLQHHNLWHEDRSSSWHGLEARVPFLDHRLVELMASIPPSLHSTLFWNKGIVRNFARKVMPEFDIQRKKVGFVYSADTRSITHLHYRMADAIGTSFIDKYENTLRRQEKLSQAKSLVTAIKKRSTGFHAKSQKLLSLMAHTVFLAQTSKQQRVPSACPHALLPVLDEDDWFVIQRHFGKRIIDDPLWQQSDIPVFAEDATLRVVQVDAQHEKYQLIHEGQSHGAIKIQITHPWLTIFLKNVAPPICRKLTINQWCAELNIQQEEACTVLSELYQSGFLNKLSDKV